MPNKISFILLGDIVGKIGRSVIHNVIPKWKTKYRPDAIIANVENLAHGKGITEKTLAEMQEAGITAFTSGDHAWKKQDPAATAELLDAKIALPSNHPSTPTDYRWQTAMVADQKVFVLNLLGQVFMTDVGAKNPFTHFDSVFEEMGKPKFLLVDLHAEATSEKVAFGYYTDGRASVVYGTHTHIPTADTRIMEKGTGYQTDVGMTGSNASVLGVDKDVILNRFLETEKETFIYPESGPAWANGLYVELDAETGTCTKIQRIEEILTIK